MSQKPIKRIAIADAGRTPDIVNAVLPFIEDRYDIHITQDKDADYVFHSCLGYEVLKYTGIRIFVTGECVSPNFNISDYALGFDQLEFGDRYCYLPLFKLYKEAYTALASPRPPAEDILAQKTGLCAYVMSNTKHSAHERTAIFDALNKYKPVASGGKWRNNVGGPVADKIDFQSRYKFVLACENYSYPGYLTEKFAQAAQSDAVPIYWGDPTIAQIFNPKAFINCHEFSNSEALLAKVRAIDSDDNLYKKMLSEPWFQGGEEPTSLKDQNFTQFLSHIFDQPYEQAFRRNRSRWGIKIEKRLFKMAFQTHIQMCERLKYNWRNFTNKF